MTDETDPSQTDDTSPEGDVSTDGTEDALAELRARLAGKDRAHSAREAEWKEGQKKMTDELETLRADKARLEAALAVKEQEAQAASIAARKARFPLAAESLGDDHLASMAEETLSNLEGRLSGGAIPEGGRVLSSAPQRPTGGEKPLADKSREELLADLERQAPEFAASLGGD